VELIRCIESQFLKRYMPHPASDAARYMENSQKTTLTGAKQSR
jgi:hypothetical protein